MPTLDAHAPSLAVYLSLPVSSSPFQHQHHHNHGPSTHQSKLRRERQAGRLVGVRGQRKGKRYMCGKNMWHNPGRIRRRAVLVQIFHQLSQCPPRQQVWAIRCVVVKFLSCPERDDWREWSAGAGWDDCGSQGQPCCRWSAHDLRLPHSAVFYTGIRCHSCQQMSQGTCFCVSMFVFVFVFVCVFVR